MGGNGGMDARRVYSSPVERDTGVISDPQMMPCGSRPVKAYSEQLRRIRFKNPKTGKTPVFLTNARRAPLYFAAPKV